MTELPPGSVTTADLYRALTDMHKDISKALEKLALIDQRNISADILHTDHEARLRALEEKLPDNMETRIGKLERFKFTLLGAVMLAAAGAGWAAQLIAGLHHP